MDPTPYHVVRVVLSKNSIMTHPDFDSRRSFFVGFSTLWAPAKPMTNLAVNTDHVVEYNFGSIVAPPVLPDAMNIPISTSLPINHTLGCSTDSVAVKELAALLLEADEIEKLEAQAKEKENELSRRQKSLNLLRNCCKEL